jgi:hypothetical protein
MVNGGAARESDAALDRAGACGFKGAGDTGRDPAEIE